MRQSLTNITLRGFKTIKNLPRFAPGAISVLIGPNGAGKTNFISFFRLLSWALTPPGNLQTYVAQLGGASMLLHDGPKRTREVEANLEIQTSTRKDEYGFRLVHVAGDKLVFADEHLPGEGTGRSKLRAAMRPDAEKESTLIPHAERGDETARIILGMLR